MKNKYLTFFALIGLMLTGLLALAFISFHDNRELSQLKNQSQVSDPDGYTVASISKGTILLLLAGGVIGFLGVCRRKKNTDSRAQNNEKNTEIDDRDLNEDKQKLMARNS